MKKIIFILLTLIVLISTGTSRASAENVAENSGALIVNTTDNDFDFRVENLKNFFEKYNSPLASYAREFIIYADENNLDYRLIPAITGVESTFGKHIPQGSFNAYGWANGDYKFISWEDSISHVTEALKKKYIDRGIDTISEIAKVYAPPSTTWGGKVSYFVKKIDTLPLDFDII